MLSVQQKLGNINYALPRAEHMYLNGIECSYRLRSVAMRMSVSTVSTCTRQAYRINPKGVPVDQLNATNQFNVVAVTRNGEAFAQQLHKRYWASVRRDLRTAGHRARAQLKSNTELRW